MACPLDGPAGTSSNCSTARIRRTSLGNLGDIKPLREGPLELRVDYGPGYRLYCIRKGQVIIVLLSGGDKISQSADIEKALTLAKEWGD